MQDQVSWSSHLSALNKEMFTIVNETDLYDIPGLTTRIKRKGYILPFFTIGHKSPNVS